MTLQNLDYRQVHTIDLIEAKRIVQQAHLDASKTLAERNRLGQYATPGLLASEILNYSKPLLPVDERIRFLDPAIGTGSFYSALLKIVPLEQIEAAVGYEIDSDYATITSQLWSKTPLNLNIADFTEIAPPVHEKSKFNFLICNPPYVRHHHLTFEQKKKLKNLAIKAAGIQLSGLAGLYCYFLLASHQWMAKDGLACWLIPSEFMDVNYGKKIRDYLLTQVSLIRVHRFASEDLQFEDALVSTSVIWFKNTQPATEHPVEFTAGQSINMPTLSKVISSQCLRQMPKWPGTVASNLQKIRSSSRIKLSDLFEIKRGVATGANHFFILTSDQTSQLNIPSELLTPILPSPRYLSTDEILADEQGNPNLASQQFLLTCKLQLEELYIHYPAVWRYLQQGVESGISERYLCRHRSLWYLQETRNPAPFLCTYMGRYRSKNGKPFRFILNHSKAIAPNVYLMMYPKQHLAALLVAQPMLVKPIWQALNSISMLSLMLEGRSYGDGLHKLEPRELANVPADTLLTIVEQVNFAFS